MGSSKATNVACSVVFDPDTNSALSRQLEIELFVLIKGGFCFDVVDIYFGVGHSRAHY
jgi:hypothetical protein